MDRAEFFSEFCARNGLLIRRVHKPGANYTVLTTAAFVDHNPNTLLHVHLYRDLTRVRVSYASDANAEFPKKEFGNIFVDVFTDTLETTREYGYCCMCEDPCNASSQTCGACPRARYGLF
jgi:hypothetical protein